MKKVLMFVFAIVALNSVLCAYNPPVGGEDLFSYSSPDALSGKQSVTGGAIFSAGSDSVVINPALGSGEQRVNLNLGYTFLHSDNKDNSSKVGGAFQTGILIPSKMFVFSGYINGTFIPFMEMKTGNSLNFKLGLAKEITDKLDVGLGLNTGFSWGGKTDWSLSGNLGFNYNFGDLGFLKDFRYGMSVLNLGKNYSKSNFIGNYKDSPVSPFPTIATIAVGAAGSLLKNDIINIGASLDVATAFFQNLMINANVQAVIKDMFFVSIGEKFNMVECIGKNWNLIPSIGISFKFSFDAKNNEYLVKKGWNESEMTISAAYKKMYSSVNAFSLGADLDLGMEDTAAPVIEFLDDEEE